MSLNGSLVLIFWVSIVAGVAVQSLMRSRVNQHLPPSLRIRFWERDFSLLRLHKQYYPDSPLRFWFWCLILLTVGSWIAGAYLQATARH